MAAESSFSTAIMQVLFFNYKYVLSLNNSQTLKSGLKSCGCQRIP